MLGHFLPILRLEFAHLQTAFNEGRLALAEILSACLRLLSEDDDIDKTDVLAHFLALAITTVHGQAKVGDGGAIGSIPDLWISGEIPHEDDLIKPGHVQVPRKVRFRKGAGAVLQALR